MKSRRFSIQQVLFTFVALVIVVFLLDTVFGDGGLNVYGDIIASSSNQFWSAVWFSEAVSFIVLPIVLVIYLKQRPLSLLPLSVTSLITLCFAFNMVASQYEQYPDDWYYANPVTTTYRILHSTIPYQFTSGNEDPQLISPIGPFMVGQLPFLIGLAIGSGLLYGVRKYKTSKS